MPRRRLFVLLAIAATACGGETTAPGSSAPVTFITLSVDRDTLLTRETLDVPVRLSDESHAVLTDRPVSWTSSDSSVLSVSRGGVITALRAGTATITAASGAVSASHDLTVRSLHFVDVAVSNHVSCGLEVTGELWCWGLIPAGGFGNGSSKNVRTPVPRRSAIGHRFSAFAVAAADGDAGDFACGVENGAVLCWGSNANGQLGDGTFAPYYTPVAVAGLPPATAVVTGAIYNAAFACALVAGGQVHCWGSNVDGQLGDGTRTDRTTPGPVPGISGASTITAGQAQVCALVGSAASCWGSDFRGELGHDTTYDRLSPVPGGVGPGVPSAWSAVGADEVHTCALTVAGAAWCWGSYNTGVFDGWDVLADLPVAQAVGHQFVRLADGGRSQCGLEAGGDVWCWIFGHQPFRFPSTRPFVDVVVSWREACALDVDGAAHCIDVRYGVSPDQPPVPLLMTGAPPLVRLAADDDIACGLTAAGAVWCWGVNSYPTIGPAVLASGATVFASIWSGGYSVCALTAAGDAWCRSVLGSGQLTPEATGYSLSAVARGWLVSCGLTTAGTALCWDRNNNNANGQLGDGTRTGHTTPAPVAGGITFASIAVGDRHACGRTTAGALYCWGEGFWGQMGDGTAPIIRSPVPVSGSHAFSALASGGGLVTCGLDAGGVAVCWPRATETVPGPQLMSIAVGGGLDTGGCGLDLVGAPSCWTAQGTGWRMLPVPTGARFATIRAGGGVACGITAAGSTWCWGTNQYGTLGSPDAAGLGSSAVPVPVYGSE